MRIVSLLVPIRSGIYQFHCNLLRGLTNRDFAITWLCSGSTNATLIAEEGGTLSDGEIVAQGNDGIVQRTRALLDRIESISPELILCHARGDPVDLNAVRYLTSSIPRLLVVHGSTLAVYRSATALRDHVNVAVAVSPRIQQDLTSCYGFSDRNLRLIPHGVDITTFAGMPLRDGESGPIRILSHGRLDRNKGVFLLPNILSELARHSANWLCTVSGDGPDREELQCRIARSGLSDKVHFTGWTAPKDVPKLMNQSDVFVFPTKYEGNPLALIEAMAGGCAPVASRLTGITDWVIKEGANGFLFPVGDFVLAAKCLLDLATNRYKLTILRKCARNTAVHFSLDSMSVQYADLFSRVDSSTELSCVSENLDKYTLPKGLRPAFWYGLPEPVKEHLRNAREKARRFLPIP